MPKTDRYNRLSGTFKSLLAMALLLPAGISACRSDESVSPDGSVEVGTPSFTVTVPPSQTFVIPVPPTSDVGPTAPRYVSTGVTVPVGLSARMKVTGIITATSSAACTNPAPPFDIWWSGNRFGWLGPLGGAEIKWFIGPITGQEFPNSFSFFEGGQPDSGVVVWSPSALDTNGEVIFRREPFSVACGLSPAYLLSGQQQVQVDFMTVDVTASKTSIQVNESVAFTATPINFTPSDPGYIYWEYHRDDAPGVPVAVESCFGQSNCTFAPPVPGKMLALMLVSGGSVPGYSPAIHLITCPTGDPVLDDPSVRQGLLDELALSRPNPDGSGRIERRGYIYQWDDGTYLLSPANDPSATMCGFSFSDLPVPPAVEGATFIGDYHTHPSKHLEILTGCPGQKAGEVWRANRKARTGGGSDGDWDFTNIRGKSHYIIDVDKKVWRLDANTLPSARKNNPNRWKFTSSADNCLERT